MHNLLEEPDINPQDIKPITYYAGQVHLLRRMIGEETWSENHKRDSLIKDRLEVSTVDAFQGREDGIVIADFVAACDLLATNSSPVDHGPDHDDDETEEYVKVGRVTGHVKNPNRVTPTLEVNFQCQEKEHALRFAGFVGFNSLQKF